MIDDMAMTPDRETLRTLADEGNEQALDRLADLADERGDVEELSELWTKGRCTLASCSRAARSPRGT